MRGKEVDTANVDNLSRPVASRVDEVRMVVADRVSWSLGLGAFVKVQTAYPCLFFPVTAHHGSGIDEADPVICWWQLRGSSQVVPVIKNLLPMQETDAGSIPGLERSPGGEHGNPI